ncbi:protoporphyrinogen oxidase [bacterium BMS3Abin09]|nr:protoporphyrinogen oxidase [bacterium BMS3Abin09]GBE41642.1 protoporphyrinogen oxidase [bacterium BMS3Bbin09]
MKKISVVGGGISGLTIAYLLLNKMPELDVTVYEADNRPGGKIWTEQADGYLCERGANGFLDNKPMTLELCKSLGIEPVRSNENSKKRFILSGGKLNALPESPLSFIKSDLLSWGGKIRLIGELIAPKGPDDETVAAFITRRLGKEALEKLIDPMCSGIYAGDPYNMSMKSCFPRIKELEQEYGSLIKALIQIKKQRKNENVSAAPAGNLTSFYDGAQTITDALAQKIGERLRLGVPVQGISMENGRYQVHTANDTENADIVVMASPAYASSGMMKDMDTELSKILSDIPYPHVSVVCFGYKKEHLTHGLNGFGFLVPSIEKRRILGTLWDSSIFPNRASGETVLLRTMIGGAKHPEMKDYDDNKISDIAFEELRPLLGLKKDPDMLRVYRWEKAIPQYIPGHIDKLKMIDEHMKKYPGLYLTGNAYKGIGINDCVMSGYRIADEILDSIQE